MRPRVSRATTVVRERGVSSKPARQVGANVPWMEVGVDREMRGAQRLRQAGQQDGRSSMDAEGMTDAQQRSRQRMSI
eukprot:4371226-Prymnesium_polylepis.1